MSKNRDKFKKAAVRANKEDTLDSKNIFGVGDPTPRGAVAQIMRSCKQCTAK
ncbi:MAG TPA: hypothetical protein VN456_00810 [Desulfosporosinus sp.]|nr:hypothetical protein [Desulfosporosinus sp.]